MYNFVVSEMFSVVNRAKLAGFRVTWQSVRILHDLVVLSVVVSACNVCHGLVDYVMPPCATLW